MKPFLLIICNSLFPFTLLAQWNGFATFNAYPVNEPVNLFHIKDITGDGVADITTLYSAGHLKMGFLTGKGNGQFYAEQTVDKEENYFLSDVADLNGDGLADMVISSYWANGFKIFLGKGAGQFSEGVYVATGVHGRAVKCVDINKDGKTDIVSVTSGSGNTISLHVFIGKGDGSFFPKKNFPSVLDTSKDIFITDKNGDGLPDVAVSSSFPWLVIFYQTPEGDFVPSYVPTYTTARVNFYDFDKDGREDLLLLYSSFDNTSGSDSMIIKLNTGSDNFSDAIKITHFQQAKLRPFHVQIADVNNDGYADIFMNHTDLEGYITDTLFYMLGNGNPSFSSPQSIVMPATIATFALADVNADGKQDLIVSCSDKKLYVSLNSFAGPDELPSEIVIYPSPARTSIRLKGLPSNTKTISIYNASGHLVSRYSQWTNNQFSTANLSAGIYFIQITTDTKRISKSFIIQ